MQTILAPIDFSPVSRRVIDEAVAQARARAARVVVLHVVAPPPEAGETAPAGGEASRRAEAWMREARERLKDVQRRLKAERIAVETLCVAGRPAEQIVALAETLGANCVVVGAHGYAAWREPAEGGTARAVRRGATGRVVVVPEPAAETGGPHRR